MKKLITIFIALLCLCNLQGQSVYYVATDGNDLAAGTIGSPWATWNKAFATADAGDTVYIRGGVYYSTSSPTIANSGTQSSWVCIFAYPDETPILDCSPRSGLLYNVGITLEEKEYVHFKGLTIRNVWQSQYDETLYSNSWGVGAVSCANLTFENITIHNIAGRGYWMTSGAWGTHAENPIFASDTTRWINCDTYDLCDTINYFIYPAGYEYQGWAAGDTAHRPGNSADAWKTIHYAENYVYWENCRAWNYSDDGWDPSNVDGAERVLINCWAMASNKYDAICRAQNWMSIAEEWSQESAERNGFKINSEHPDVGGIFDTTTIRMQNCIALFSAVGFLEIGSCASNGLYYNNTSYQNSIYGFAGYFAAQNSVYRNNLVYDITDDVYLRGDYVSEKNNTWTSTSSYPYWAVNDTVTVTGADFVSVDSTTLVSLFIASRQSDGTLPVLRPLMLASTSDLIDAGIDVGLPYASTAPDIGYSEYIGELTEVTSITVSGTGGATTISTNDGTLQMLASVLPVDATYQTVTWSRVNGTGTASITSSGILTAITDGTVTVRATAVDGSGVYDEQVITISNQVVSVGDVFIKIGGKLGKSIRGNFIKK